MKDQLKPLTDIGLDVDKAMGDRLSLRDLYMLDNVAKRMGLPTHHTVKTDNILARYYRNLNL